ncbi:MAG: hypothetical protein JJU33_14395 [Phycisphaerales bacterium]|nr:hypothetical protein [Phycisphaerales bacterium]
MNLSTKLLFGLLCWGCVAAAMARPPAFSDLTLQEGLLESERTGKPLVVFWYRPEQLMPTEFMRAVSWHDPDVVAWMREHAVGVWIEGESGGTLVARDSDGRRSRFFDDELAMWLPGRRFRTIEPTLAPECLLLWLSFPPGDPGLVEAVDDCTYEVESREFRRLRRLREDDSPEARLEGLIDAWSDFARLHLPNFLAQQSLAAKTEEWIEQFGMHDKLEAVGAAIEQRLRERETPSDRLAWVMFNAVIGDRIDSVIDWADLAEEPLQHRLAAHAFDIMFPRLIERRKWELIGRLDPRWHPHTAQFGYFEHVSWIRGSTSGFVQRRIPRKDPSVRFRPLSFLQFPHIQERAEKLAAMHLGCLAIGELGEASVMLHVVSQRCPPEVLDYIIGFAAREGMLDAVHLPYLDPENPGHAELIEKINAQENDR